jgi:hypothetical protein
MVAAILGKSWRRYVEIALSFAVLYAAAYIFGAQFRSSTGVSPFWPGAGVWLAWFIVGGARQMPVAFLTLLGLRFAFRPDFDLPQDALKALILTVGYASVAGALHRLVQFDQWWRGLRPLAFFLGITLPSCLLIGFAATVSLTPTESQQILNIGEGLRFGLGDFIGCLMCGPLLSLSILCRKEGIGAFRKSMDHPGSWRAAEIACHAALMVA